MATYTVTIMPAGWRFAAPDDASLLIAAEDAGIGMPSSCRNGTCRTCLCKLASGSVRYLVEWPGLSIEEKREQYVLPCVAVAQSDLVLEAPLARRLWDDGQGAHD
ncbi:MAG TPA: 2Fe-2S iron-sulfur cluster-binding protein [Telluria sp.]|nr:2Fe-2S iron-sulfur cluster-binding protein [Telluria sp.]